MLLLKVISVKGSAPAVECDSVHLNVREDSEGRMGGSMGIRQGHIKSLIALDKGAVVAYLDGKEVFSCVVSGGFATVDNDTVRVVTEGIE